MSDRKKKKHTKRPEYDRLVFDILHALVGQSANKLSKQSFLAASTIRKIRNGPANGGTRYPRGITAQELARLAGGTVKFHPRTNDFDVNENIVPFKKKEA